MIKRGGKPLLHIKSFPQGKLTYKAWDENEQRLKKSKKAISLRQKIDLDKSEWNLKFSQDWDLLYTQAQKLVQKKKKKR